MIANPIQIKMPRPHGGQFKMLDCLARGISVVAFCGRRFGKTQVAVYGILRAATQTVGLYWWVGLSWRSASLKRAWRLLKMYVRQIWRAFGVKKADKHIREADKELYLPNGSSIWLRTAERPDSLAGEGIRGVVLDEFSLMEEVVWTEYIEATLLDYEGWALFIGVPKGENWAATLWRRAQTRKGWQALHFTTYDNPFMSRERIDEIKANVTEALFNQEYMAEITPDAGAVFRGVRHVITAPMKPVPVVGRRYVAGLDWAKDNDYTVMVVFDADRRQMVAMERFNQVNWSLQRKRVVALYEKWGISEIYAEANSIGGPNIEALQAEGLPVKPFMTTAQSKTPLIEALALAIEREDISLQDEPVLINELQAYTMERLPSGSYRYGAPSGMHDDTVIATALAYMACRRSVMEVLVG